MKVLNDGGGVFFFYKYFKHYSITFKNILGGMINFLTPPLFTKSFNDGGGLFFLQALLTKHKKWIFSATVHLIRKKFIFPGRYLKADHFEMLRGRGV